MEAQTKPLFTGPKLGWPAEGLAGCPLGSGGKAGVGEGGPAGPSPPQPLLSIWGHSVPVPSDGFQNQACFCIFPFTEGRGTRSVSSEQLSPLKRRLWLLRPQEPPPQAGAGFRPGPLSGKPLSPPLPPALFQVVGWTPSSSPKEGDPGTPCSTLPGEVWGVGVKMGMGGVELGEGQRREDIPDICIVTNTTLALTLSALTHFSPQSYC